MTTGRGQAMAAAAPTTARRGAVTAHQLPQQLQQQQRVPMHTLTPAITAPFPTTTAIITTIIMTSAKTAAARMPATRP